MTLEQLKTKIASEEVVKDMLKKHEKVSICRKVLYKKKNDKEDVKHEGYIMGNYLNPFVFPIGKGHNINDEIIWIEEQEVKP